MDIDIKTEENTEYKGKIILKVGKLVNEFIIHYFYLPI